jgi:UDP-N-acetylglucosamine--N-acetylmuramyl-(pentapeptide) pyrophosphoryl-undecaprenol N-acetylglucosamine transferase
MTEKHLARVIFTCGGTAGHVNPAIALAQWMHARDPNTAFLFVGADRGLERDLISRAGYDFRTVHISSFHRSMRPSEIRHNLVSVYNLLRAPREARAILKSFQPDVVVGTGGYASFPMVKAAAKAGIPTAVHESNMVPGLTTKMLEPFAGKIMVGFEDCRQYYRHPEKVVVTGTPVRSDFFARTREEAKRKMGVTDGRPLIVSFWGSLGASGMNEKMADFLALEAEHMPFYHLHGAGASGYPLLMDTLRERGVNLERCPSIRVQKYIYDMATAMRAADLVICRAGASTVSEVTAMGVPALMVPSPYVTNHHQEKNARALEKAGGAAVLTEPEANGQELFRLSCGILHDSEKWAAMAAAMEKLGVPDATERIYRTVMELCG